jgi:hypothetical protein
VTTRQRTVAVNAPSAYGGVASGTRVVIASGFGDANAIDLRAALEHVGQMVCGAMAVEGGVAILRHAAPLIALDVNEFERPLQLVVSSAGQLEQQFSGSDTY